MHMKRLRRHKRAAHYLVHMQKLHRQFIMTVARAALFEMVKTILVFQNPFEPNDGLVNIASGLAASEKVQSDILSAAELGEAAFLKFVRERLLSSAVPSFDKLPAHKLATFTSMQSSTTVSTRSRANAADRTMFARLLVVAQNCGMDMCSVLTYNLRPLPLSLLHLMALWLKPTKLRFFLCWNQVCQQFSLSHPTAPGYSMEWQFCRA